MDQSCVVSDNLITTNTSAGGNTSGVRVVPRSKTNKVLPPTTSYKINDYIFVEGVSSSLNAMMRRQ